jgi:hypothetical protein
LNTDVAEYTPTGYEVRGPSKIYLSGNGDVDLSGLNEATNDIEIIWSGSYLTSFIPKADITTLTFESKSKVFKSVFSSVF